MGSKEIRIREDPKAGYKQPGAIGCLVMSAACR